MTNLLKETKTAIKKSNHTPNDIIFIGSEKSGHRCSWDEFCILADGEYDSGYGGQEVAMDLIIVFNDGQQMWRGEYDGSEWWEYSTPLAMPEVAFPVTRLVRPEGHSGWNNLADIN